MHRRPYWLFLSMRSQADTHWGSNATDSNIDLTLCCTRYKHRKSVKFFFRVINAVCFVNFSFHRILPVWRTVRRVLSMCILLYSICTIILYKYIVLGNWVRAIRHLCVMIIRICIIRVIPLAQNKRNQNADIVIYRSAISSEYLFPY